MKTPTLAAALIALALAPANPRTCARPSPMRRGSNISKEERRKRTKAKKAAKKQRRQP